MRALDNILQHTFALNYRHVFHCTDRKSDVIEQLMPTSEDTKLI